MRIAIDVMSGDKGLDVAISAVKSYLKKSNQDNIKVILVGRIKEIQSSLQKHKLESNCIKIVDAPEVVYMGDLPRDALRYKKKSSMRVAINLVKNNEADAVVSAGNTGALMATAKFVLKTIKGIDRPAIATKIPSHKGSVTLLDLGANINCSPVNLYQFALMGSTISQADISSEQGPRVALLNIGHESTKGPETIREAADIIKSNRDINYIGFIESNNIHNDIADVIITDGFTGNIVLKTIEGLSKFINDILKQGYSRNIYTKLMALLATGVFNRIKNKLDARKYNGASLLGLNGTVIKSHGGADKVAFEYAIVQAISEVKSNIVGSLKEKLEDLTSEEVV